MMPGASCALQHTRIRAGVALPPLHLTYLVVHLQVPLAKGASPFGALRFAVGQGKVVPPVTVGREYDLPNTIGTKSV